ncbi:signal peptidase I [Streptomyces capparidis]
MSGSTAVDGEAGGAAPTAARPARSRAVAWASNAAVGVGLVLLFGGFLLGAFTYRPYAVPTDSMTPTIAVGDRVLAQRIDGGDVRRGDVVVFNDPLWGNVTLIKRVVAVGGDTVACCDERGRLSVNGTAVDEPYLDGDGPASPTEFEAKVPEGRLFLLGDNRTNSQDSRSHLADQQGTVPRSAVTGRVDGTAWPFGRIGAIGHDRTFAALGPVSDPGPLWWLVAACLGGSVLILLGAAAGPVADRMARRGSARA